MKYIMEHKYEIKCEYYYYVTHGGECCSNDNPNLNCKGLPCYLNLYPDIIKIPSFDVNVKDELCIELMDKIDTKDLQWAIQNLQSDNYKKKLVAKFLMDNN